MGTNRKNNDRYNYFGIASCIAALCIATSLNAQTIKVIAGGGSVLVQNSSGPIVSTTASIAPSGIAVDPSGNVYFGDAGQITNGKDLIDKLTPSGSLSAIAGDYTGTPSQLPAPANSVRIALPAYMAYASNGALYYSAIGQSPIFEDSPTGVVSVAIGGGGNCTYYWSGVSPNVSFPNNCGVQSSSGIAIDPAGYIYSADSFYNNPYEYSPSTGKVYYMAGSCGAAHGVAGYTPVGSCTVNVGTAIGSAYYAGSLFVLDEYYDRLYKVTPATDNPPVYTTTATIAGGGTSFPSSTPEPASIIKFNNPIAIAVDSYGNFYIVDEFYNYTNNTYSTVLDKYTASTATVALIAGGGATTPSTTPMPALSAALHRVNAVTVDSSGNIYLSDGAVYGTASSPTGLIEEISN